MFSSAAFTLATLTLATLSSAIPTSPSYNSYKSGSSSLDLGLGLSVDASAKVYTQSTPALDSLSCIIEDAKEKLTPVVEKCKTMEITYANVKPVCDETISVINEAIVKAKVHLSASISIDAILSTLNYATVNVEGDAKVKLDLLVKECVGLLTVIVGTLGKIICTIKGIDASILLLLKDVGAVLCTLFKVIFCLLGPLCGCFIKSLLSGCGEFASFFVYFGLDVVLKVAVY